MVGDSIRITFIAAMEYSISPLSDNRRVRERGEGAKVEHIRLQEISSGWYAGFDLNTIHHMRDNVLRMKSHRMINWNQHWRYRYYRLCYRMTKAVFHNLYECEALDMKRQAIFRLLKINPEDYFGKPAPDLYRLE